MSQSITINGVSYLQPDQGTPPPWGDTQAEIIVALANSTLQKNGGTFTLAADADFGASFGLQSIYLKSRTANPSSAGILRLAVTDTVGFRNNANNANLLLAVNGSNQLTFNGSVLALGSGDVAGPASATDKAFARFNSTTGKIIQNSSATLDDTGIATFVGVLISGLTASRSIITDGSKNLSSSATTATEIGYVSGVTSSIQTQLNLRTTIANSKLRRPDFYANPSDLTQVIVPATASAPALVLINGIYYTNTSNATLDIDTSGRNGIDTGSKATNHVYYLYAIPPTSGTTFDLVCSSTAPTTGPTGFANWSYLGSFCTNASTVVMDFSSCGGICLWSFANGTINQITSSTRTALSLGNSIPATAKSIYCRSAWSTVNAIGDTLVVGPLDDSNIGGKHIATSTTASNNNISYWWCSVLGSNSVYAAVTSNSDNCGIRTFGFSETPEEYQ